MSRSLPAAIVGVVLALGVDLTAAHAASASLTFQDLMPEAPYTYVNDTGSHGNAVGNEHGVINLIVYGPTGLVFAPPSQLGLDIPDNLGWSTEPHTTLWADIRSGCGDDASFQDQEWSPDASDLVHNEAKFWPVPTLNDQSCTIGNVGRPGVQVLYAAASVYYATKFCFLAPNCSTGFHDASGNFYECSIGNDCSLPNGTAAIANSGGRSGFDFGRDGLPEAIGVNDGFGHTYSAPGLGSSIVDYLHKRGWATPAGTGGVVLYDTKLRYVYDNLDDNSSNRSSTAIPDGKVAFICAYPSNVRFQCAVG